MSILSDYQKYNIKLGAKKTLAIEKYLSLPLNKNLDYSKLIYSKSEYEKFEDWYGKSYFCNS